MLQMLSRQSPCMHQLSSSRLASITQTEQAGIIAGQALAKYILPLHTHLLRSRPSTRGNSALNKSSQQLTNSSQLDFYCRCCSDSHHPAVFLQSVVSVINKSFYHSGKLNRKGWSVDGEFRIRFLLQTDVATRTASISCLNPLINVSVLI